MPSPALVIVDGRDLDLDLDLNIVAATPALRTCEPRDPRACACVPSMLHYGDPLPCSVYEERIIN